MTGYKSKKTAAQDKLAMTKTEALRMALDALERVMSHGQAVQEAKDILAEALAQPERLWVGLTDEEIDTTWKKWIGTERANKSYTLAIEAKLKEKNT